MIAAVAALAQLLGSGSAAVLSDDPTADYSSIRLLGATAQAEGILSSWYDSLGWTPIDSPSSCPYRSLHGCCWDPVNDVIYMYGGRDSSGDSSYALCQRYDPAANIWTDVAPMMTPRESFKGLYCRGKLHAIGGERTYRARDPWHRLDSCEAYDIAAGTWRQTARLPVATRSYQAAVWRDSLIYVLGGYSGVDIDTVRIYNPFTDRWTLATSMPAPCSMSDACIIGDTIYVVGGMVEPSLFDSTMRIGAINPSAPEQIEWSWGPSWGDKRISGPTVALDGRVYWFGGLSEMNAIANVHSYAPKVGNIGSLPDYPTPVRGGALGVGRNGRHELYGLAGCYGDFSTHAGYWKLKPADCHDVGPTGVAIRCGDSTPPWVERGDTIEPWAEIKNFGVFAEQFTVQLRIDNESPQHETVQVRADDSATVIFPRWVVASAGQHSLSCRTLLPGDQQPDNDLKLGSFEARAFEPGLGGWNLSDTMTAGTFQPIVLVCNGGQVPGSIRVNWQTLREDTLPVYAQSESVYLPTGGTREVRLPVWDATPGSYLAKIFITVKGSTVRDTVRRRFVVLPVGLAESAAEPLPTEYSLDIASPNPNRDGRIAIRYDLPVAVPVVIKLYDLTGRAARTLVNALHKPGRYSLSFDTHHSSFAIPPGVYFIRLTSPNCERTRKAVVAE